MNTCTPIYTAAQKSGILDNAMWFHILRGQCVETVLVWHSFNWQTLFDIYWALNNTYGLNWVMLPHVCAQFYKGLLFPLCFWRFCVLLHFTLCSHYIGHSPDSKVRFFCKLIDSHNMLFNTNQSKSGHWKAHCWNKTNSDCPETWCITRRHQ